MNAAFVHDWLAAYAGAEKVLEAMLPLFPEAPIHTLVYQPAEYAGSIISRHTVHTSFLDRYGFLRKRYRSLLPLMPLAIECFDLSDFDLVISSSHAVAKGVLVRADQLHISYVHTPVRYAWDLHAQYLRESGLDRGVKGAMARLALHYLRTWDAAAANRVDVFVANSKYVARRIARTYRRDARVIYPPVDVSRFSAKGGRSDFYLVVSRMVPYKKIDLIAQAFTTAAKPLIVIGDGPDMAKVQQNAGPTVKILGHCDDETVREYMENCRGFVIAADEDFGISVVEAQAAGAPVLAYGRGGALETVLPGVSGLFYDQPNVSSLVDGIMATETLFPTLDPERIRENAERFSAARFEKEMSALIDEEWARHRSSL